MNNILILGGTGAMGTHLVSLLSNNPDNKIYVTSRKEHLGSSSVCYILGDAKDDGFLLKMLEENKWNTIIDFMTYTLPQFERRVDVLLKSTDQYIFLSSSRVYADSKEKITENSYRLLDVCEDKEYLRTDEYALAKAREENVLYKNERNNWTIIRPYITYSENKFQLGVMEKEDWLYRALRGRSIVFSDDIAKKFTSLTYGYDVARGIAALVGKSAALGNIFHITAQPARWSEICNFYIDAIERCTGKKVKLKMIPYNNRVLSRKKNIFIWQVIYDRYYDRIFDNTKISNFVDITSFYSAKEGIYRCIESFVKSPKFNNINWRLEAFHDKCCGEYTPIKEIPGIKTKIKYLVNRFLRPLNCF